MAFLTTCHVPAVMDYVILPANQSRLLELKLHLDANSSFSGVPLEKDLSILKACKGEPFMLDHYYEYKYNSVVMVNGTPLGINEPGSGSQGGNTHDSFDPQFSFEGHSIEPYCQGHGPTFKKKSKGKESCQVVHLPAYALQCSIS